MRNSDDEVKTAHLRALGEALPGTLTLHAADLLQPGSFDNVIRQGFNGTNMLARVECILLTQRCMYTQNCTVDVGTLDFGCDQNSIAVDGGIIPDHMHAHYLAEVLCYNVSD